MWLARLELQTVLGTLAQRFPATELVDERPHWRSTPSSADWTVCPYG
jgi:cytochrome P450